MIFIDTGAFIARYLTGDQHHSIAVKTWQDLSANNTPIFTSSFVIDELITFLGRRTSPAYAVEAARVIYASRILQVLRPDEHDEIKALHVFEKGGVSGVSFTDCISAVLMRRNAIRRVFTFDRHFAMLGFKLLPYKNQ